jgi:predicted ATPase/class 3 adenylate cyclase
MFFSDMENSTPLWENHPDLMQALSARHDILIRAAIEGHRGRVIKTMGDGFHAVFAAATDGVAAALAGQQAIIEESWPAETGAIRVRMGLHTGESELRDGDYYGPEVNRAARVMGIAYGGQILVSDATAGLIRKSLPPDVTLTDLGEHRLKGIAAAEQIYQLCHPSLPADFPPLKSLSTYRHNLPAQPNTFVGREKELADVKRLLKETRLLTLLGPGGTGKTRLMLAAAEEMIEDFRDGVWLVELAPLTDPNLIAERVAATLDVQEQPGRALLDALVDYLRPKELLLLLDNVEHVVKECAVFTEQLLARCPRLKVLVTGREGLFIEGETTLQVPSLSLPGARGEPDPKQLTPDTIRASEAVHLFLIRARAVQPDFDVTPENVTAVADIVRRLDGIPLALELAAARLRMLSVEQIDARLGDRFRLLTGGRRTALPRQQTLQALIDWSWNLLEEDERILLRRLSVFSGGWSLEAAQAVTGDDQAGYNQLDEYAVLDSLEGLINKSLVTVERRQGSETRYGMLESIRQYARDRLLESGEGEALRARHADYFVAFALEVEAQMVRSETLLWIDRTVLDLDNLRSAIAWTLDERPELALRICGALLSRPVFWILPREARSWLEPAIKMAQESLEREESPVEMVDFIKALQALAVMQGLQGNTPESLRLFEESIHLAREAGEPGLASFAVAMKAFRIRFSTTPELMAELEHEISVCREFGLDRELPFVLFVMCIILLVQGDFEAARPYLDEAIEATQRDSRPDAASHILSLQADLARTQGNYAEAREFYSQYIESSLLLRDRWSANRGMSELAHVYRYEGNLEEAESYYRKTILGWQEIGHDAAVAHELECFAFITIGRGQHVRAARLLGAATRTRERLDKKSADAKEIAELAQAMEQLAEAMGVTERDAAIAEGRLIELDEAVLLALNEIP